MSEAVCLAQVLHFCSSTTLGGPAVLRSMPYCIDSLGANSDIVDFMDRSLSPKFLIYGTHNNDIYALFIHEDMIKIKIE